MSAPPHPEPENLRVSTKLFYGLGSVSEGTKNTAFNVFLLFYYNQVLGLSGTLSGAAIFVALCVDAITDPLMGSISDNFHSRWGRRHPFMYASALPMATFFYLLFNPFLVFSPETLGQTGLFVWLWPLRRRRPGVDDALLDSEQLDGPGAHIALRRADDAGELPLPVRLVRGP